MKYTLNLLLVSIVSITCAKASNYYFSSISGFDSRSPFEARNPATPWKTLEKLNSIFYTLLPGDSVFLKRGEVFYGSIAITKSGNAFSPIFIGAYGAGNKPVITGFTPLTWKPLGNNIFESQQLSAVTINVLSINGSVKAMGRYPDAGYLNFESHNGTSSITDNQLTDAQNWKGAELVLRSRRWILDRNLITNHNGNLISYTASSKYEPRDNYGYFIQNSPLTLNKQDEWYYNPDTKKIWLYSTSPPVKVNAATLNNLITSVNNNYITLNNLSIQGASKTAISINNGSHVSISYCDILSSGEYGIKVNNHANLKIEYCYILNSLNNAIDLGTSSNYAIVRYNLIQNTAALPGMGLSGDKKGIALFTTGNKNSIEYNRIVNTGYTAIYFAGDSTLLKNNFVDSFCTVKDDGGGIYSYIGSSQPRKGRKVIGNIIMNGIGAPAGTDNIKKAEASGIYMDNNASDVEIRDNTVTTCNEYGIYLHNAAAILVENNTLFDNNVQVSLIQTPGNILIRDNVIARNLLFSKLPSQLISYFKSGADDTDLFAKFDSNYYAKPLENKLVIYNSYLSNSKKNPSQNSELTGWKESFGSSDETLKGMAAAKGRPFNPEYTVRFEYNADRIAKTVMLKGSYADIKKNRYVNNLVLQPFTSAILIKEK